MSTTTAPDFSPVVKHVPRVATEPGVTLQLMVLAADSGHCVGVDLASGTLLRAWSPVHSVLPLRPYDVVEATLADDVDAVPDPAQPDSVALTGPPEPVRRMRGRKAERLLRPLLHPMGQPLLGIASTVVPFWERSPDHPSVALVEPESRISLWRDGRYLSCRFAWQGHERELPCLDRRMASLMDRAGRTRMPADKDDRLVVALTPPIDGRCHKVVQAVLPKP